MGLIDGILNFGGKIMGKVWPDRAASREQQSQINQAEISGAPTSKLRLWRSLLGCGLTVAFLWEVISRPFIVTSFSYTYSTLPSRRVLSASVFPANVGIT